MPTALILNQDQLDAAFFAQHADRRAHIRPALFDECQPEFRSLGWHQFNRRRVLLWRIPKESPLFDPVRVQIFKVPFLAFADETIEDSDQVLLPILHEIMKEAR